MIINLLTHIAIALVMLLPFSAESANSGSQDLSTHPVYSGYEFGKDSKVIDIAVQPLAVPVGVTTEVMKRDRVLRKELSKLGKDIRFHPFMKGSDLNFFLKRGDIEAAVAGDMPLITTAAETDVIVTALAKKGFSSIISREYQQISELKGLRVGYPAGSTAHYTLLIALSQFGLSESDIDMVPLDVDKLSGALVNGQIDAFSAFEPVSTIALAAHRDFTTMMKFLNSSYLYFSKPFAEENRDASAAITASHVRALRWMRQDRANLLSACEWARAAARELSGSEIDLTTEKFSDIVENDILNIASSPVIPKKDLSEGGYVQRVFNFLKKQGTIPPQAELRKVLGSFDNSILSAVLADPDKYSLNHFDYER